MKKYHILIYTFILFILLFVLTGCSKESNQNNTQNTDNASGTRISTNVNEEQAENRIANILQNQNEIIENRNSETEISSYATTIKDKSQGRLTNISITCSTLNNTIVHKGETFSFNKVVGEPTTARGYQEASVIIDHKTEKGIGGRKLPSKQHFI